MNKPRYVPEWMRNGVRAYWDFEPVFFLRRRGGMYADIDLEEMRRQSYGEENVRRLAEMGVNLFVAHGYKGYGLEFEKKEHGLVKQLKKHCDRYGLKLGTYCQIATLAPETFPAHYPGSPDWIQRDAENRPVYWGTQTHRHIPCYNHPDYRKYYRPVVQYCLEELNSDFMHFDNFTMFPEPFSCHCRHCEDRFRDYLKNKYTQSEAENRYGFSDFRFVKPPVYPPGVSPHMLIPVTDPLKMDWDAFRCRTITDFIKELSEYIHELKPEAGVEINPGSFPNWNRYRRNATYLPELAPHTNIVWNEDGSHLPRITPNKVLATNIRGYKIGRFYRTGVFTSGNLRDLKAAEKTVCEALAFSPDFVFPAFGINPMDAACSRQDYAGLYRRYFDFHRRHIGFYHNLRQIQDVAVLRSRAILAADSMAAQIAVVLAEQVLIETGLPFCTAYDELLDNLSATRCLVLANLDALSEEACQKIIRYVKNGGGLVVTDQSACFDESYRRRINWPLAELFKNPVGKRNKTPFRDQTMAARITRVNFGNGKAVYLPTILPKVMPNFERPFHEGKIMPEDCPIPPAALRLIENVLWACNGKMSVWLEGQQHHCAAEFMENPSNGKFAGHIVNFDMKADAKNLRLHFGMRKVARLRLITPENEKETVLVPSGKSGCVFRLPTLKNYCLVHEL